MAIKPLDIRRKEFKNSLRGYEQNGVDDFLDVVADDFERILSENQSMRDQISNLRERLDQFDELEDSIRAALVHAEQAASDLRESSAREAEDTRQSAKREAELTVREAKSQARQMLSESSGRVERVRESYDALKEARGTFAADFRHLLQTYLSVMDNMDVATAQQIEATLRERLDSESITAAREAAASESPDSESPDSESPDSESDSTQHPMVQYPETSSEPEESAADDEDVRHSEGSQVYEREDELEDEEYDPDATQRIVPGTTDYPADGSDPEVDEPEIEPSSATHQEDSHDETDGSETTEPGYAEPVAFDSSDEAETTPESSQETNDSEQDTQKRTLASDSSSQESRNDEERTSRAGRFLRRRG